MAAQGFRWGHSKPLATGLTTCLKTGPTAVQTYEGETLPKHATTLKKHRRQKAREFCGAQMPTVDSRLK